MSSSIPEQVDEAVQSMKERKSTNTGTAGSSAQLSVMDYASEGLRVRMEMQRAVEEER